MKKVCKGCHQSLPLVDFALNGGGRRRTICKECYNSTRRRKYAPLHLRRLSIEERQAYALAAATRPVYFALAGKL